MIDSNPLKVLLYYDGTKHSFSAAVYTANLFNNIPNMHLTVLQIQENVEGSIEGDYNLMGTWSSNNHFNIGKHLVEENDSNKRRQYSEIMTKTNKIFTERGHNVIHKVIYSNYNIPDIVEATLVFLLGIVNRNGKGYSLNISRYCRKINVYLLVISRS